jgi:multidrug resistance efflux pump
MPGAAWSVTVNVTPGFTSAEDELGYATLKADFDGVVTAWSAEVGQVVSAGQAVVTR